MASKNDYVKVSRELWEAFLNYYSKTVEEYEWHPIPMADAVVIKNSKGQKIAEKYFGGINGQYTEGCEIRIDEFKKFQSN